MSAALLCGLAAAGAVLLGWRGPSRLPAHLVVGQAPDPGSVPVAPGPTAGVPGRRRLVMAMLAGLGGALFLGGPGAPVAAVAVAAAAWWWLGTVEPGAVRRTRERTARELPALVGLVAAALRSGAAPAEALRLACQALPGPAADRVDGAAQRLALGADPATVWRALAADEALGPLGRTLARTHETGAPVVEAVERLADELDDERRAGDEARARAVGVKAALPLGLCLLPSFLLLGIVPLAAGLLRGLTG